MRGLGLRTFGAEDEVGIESEHRIAAAHRAALDRFKQEGVPPVSGKLQEGGDRRLQVGDEACEHELRRAFRVARLEAPKGRLYLHRGNMPRSRVIAFAFGR